ncbi:hypothetical protein KPA96_13715 [Burkholderia cenocepacia]|uniref:hypothetical protein n=1 Tax=Burkholderia cenocepacia TaxID=95486 RepID=UPI00285E5280|nr:hypothetical protein [Burkholderia cenocepacia]MDR8076714.1 hypothetical protein [Burkholderia cenocepacia]
MDNKTTPDFDFFKSKPIPQEPVKKKKNIFIEIVSASFVQENGNIFVSAFKALLFSIFWAILLVVCAITMNVAMNALKAFESCNSWHSCTNQKTAVKK